MVSNRSRYVSESTTDDETGDMDYRDTGDRDYIPNNTNNQKVKTRKPTRVPKCFSKNALMARENRLKKKMYISELEGQVAALKHDNKKLNGVVEKQARMINDFTREIKYLKSVISNSEDIRKLIRNINVSTGLAVSTSIDNQLADSTTKASSPLYKQVVPDVEFSNNAKGDTLKFDLKKHPWEEQDPSYVNYPTPDSTYSYYGSPEFEELKNDGLLLDDMDLPLEMDSDELLNMIDEKALESPSISTDDYSNYHSPIKSEYSSAIENDDSDVGVCLHVSKNKVSLEFCPTCCDNAKEGWKSK
ncbi:uncharacterized protein LOC115879700 [Sitophilus oryzae]|uniref:Uncharacterized protein LOC115879700 n=1 Tax=Sitophilus oryzae TaxID=7048 RepID=A0A6J2XPD3_SITOR|nr:uncharacterized protein LOC115879700 [Sitophilus oryzae]